MNGQSNYTITPILCGTIEGSELTNLTLRRNAGRKVTVPFLMWLVNGNGLTVFVDSGPGDPDTVKKITGRDLKCDEEPAAALDRLQVRPRDVSAVVLSHLHWDHAGGLELFPEAVIYVQRRELQYAIAPLPVQQQAYEWERSDGGLPRWLASRRRMKIMEGDFDVAPGLRAVHLPGHTPGCMGLCCNTARGRHLIACDAVPTYDNLELNVPSGTYVDLEDAYRSLSRAHDIADVVLPCHDMRVLEAKIYPR